MGHLMAEFPGAELAALLLNDAIFGSAKEIESALEEKIESERKPGEAIGENAVVDVAAGGVVAGKRRGLFPGFAAATGELVIAVGQRLPAYELAPLRIALDQRRTFRGSRRSRNSRSRPRDRPGAWPSPDRQTCRTRGPSRVRLWLRPRSSANGACVT